MEENNVSVSKAGLKHGIILGGILIVISLIMHFAHVDRNSWIQFLSTAVMIAYLVYATKNFRDQDRGGFLKYGQGLGFGTLVSFVTAIITSIYMYVYMKVINPEFVDEILNKQYEGMTERGMGAEEIEMAMSMTEQWIVPSTLIGMVIGTVFVGFICSLIISAIFKRSED